MGKVKPKRPQPQTPYEPQGRDDFQTPNYAVDLLVPYLCKDWTIWEPCAGKLEKICNRLTHHGFNVFGTDLIHGLEYNVLEYLPPRWWDCAITNPPYSLKFKIVNRFVELNKPFAMLIPADWNQWLIGLVTKKNCKLLVPSRRINYITPNGKQGKESAAQFHSAWLVRGLDNKLTETVTFCELTAEQTKDI